MSQSYHCFLRVTSGNRMKTFSLKKKMGVIAIKQLPTSAICTVFKASAIKPLWGFENASSCAKEISLVWSYEFSLKILLIIALQSCSDVIGFGFVCDRNLTFPQYIKQMIFYSFFMGMVSDNRLLSRFESFCYFHYGDNRYCLLFSVWSREDPSC